MAKKTFTDQISTDEIRAYKEDKVTAVETIQYNEERTLSDMDLVYWKYIKDILPDSESMSFIGRVESEAELPDDAAYGTVALIGNTLYIVEDGDWIKTGVETFKPYSTIAALLGNQSNQNEQQIYLVEDASVDTSLKFLPGAGKHAFYKYNGNGDGRLNNYTLIAAPNAISSRVVDTYSDQKIEGLKGIVGGIYYDDVDNAIIELLDESLAPKKYVDAKAFTNLLDENNKIKDQYIPALAIVDMVDATEDTFAGFLANAENYTFEKGDFVQITDADGNREYYFYNGGDKTDGANYAPMSTEKIPWGNVSGKPTIDIDYVAGEGNETTKELKLGKVTVDNVITRGGSDRDVVLGDGVLRRLFGTETGENSMAILSNAIASGGSSLAIFTGSKALGDSTTAIRGGEAVGNFSIAIGKSKSIANFSIALGQATVSNSRASLVFGLWNIGYADSILEAGDGTSDLTRRNLLTIFKNGEIEIDSDNPKKLSYRKNFEHEEFTEDKMLPNVKFVKKEIDNKIEVAVTKGVYGIEYDVTHAAPEVTRIGDMECHKTLPLHSKMRRCILGADGNVEYYLGDYDSTLREDGNPAYLDGTDGDVMVEIPEHYEAYFSVGNINSVLVSMNSFYGARRVPKSYISAYKATLDRFVAQTPKLKSVASEFDRYRGGDGTEAWMNGIASSRYSLADYKEFARYKNNDHDKLNGLWTPAWYEFRKKVAWLITIEYATRLHRQPIVTALTPEGYKQGGLGYGPTGATGARWSAYNGYYSVFKVGLTNSLGNQTGEIPVTFEDFGGEPFETQVMSYRGIENFFGDIWEWTDGIILDADQTPPRVYTATGLKFDVSKNNGRYVGQTPESNGYIKDIAFGEHGDIVPIDNAGASSTTYFTDYFWRSSGGLRVFAFGAHLNHSDHSGSFAADTNSSPSTTNTLYGSRLCFITKT